MIQIIGFDKRYDESFSREDIVISTIDSPMSLDEFDINVINLQNSSLWKNHDDNYKSINLIEDFENLSAMIRKRINSNLLLILPISYTFNYCYKSYNHNYTRSVELKNILSEFKESILKKLIPMTPPLLFEKTKTLINGINFLADFCFDGNCDMLTQSYKSLKPTTILDNDVYITTLDIVDNYSKMCDFLREINLLQDKEELPEWLLSYLALDDEEKQEIVLENLVVIKNANSCIDQAKEALEKNKRFKSILCTNGNELVEVVFSMVEELLNCDLTSFEDKKVEDFEIKKEDCTFIGEIKGVTSNVMSKHISQLETHCQGYDDALYENGLPEEIVKGLLIINHQRNSALSERHPVDEKQIKLAIRNGSLIIETSELLKLFELFKKGEITTEQCQEMFATRTGLFKLDEDIKTKSE